MMYLKTPDIDAIKDRMKRGLITSDEANVEIVREAGAMFIESRIPSQVRKALNNAVKEGKLGHKKKSGAKPEVYYHPGREYIIEHERNKYAREKLEVMKSVSEKVFGKDYQ